jgi:hypothetical protein
MITKIFIKNNNQIIEEIPLEQESVEYLINKIYKIPLDWDNEILNKDQELLKKEIKYKLFINSNLSIEDKLLLSFFYFQAVRLSNKNNKFIFQMKKHYMENPKLKDLVSLLDIVFQYLCLYPSLDLSFSKNISNEECFFPFKELNKLNFLSSC